MRNKFPFCPNTTTLTTFALERPTQTKKKREKTTIQNSFFLTYETLNTLRDTIFLEVLLTIFLPLFCLFVSHTIIIQFSFIIMVSTTSFEESVSVGQLILFGIAFGIAHVLAGPDHVVALAVLSSSSSTRTTRDDDDDDDDDRRDENDGENESGFVSPTKRREEDEKDAVCAVDLEGFADEKKDDDEDSDLVSTPHASDAKKQLLLFERRERTRRRKENLFLGFSWALGHSFGLAVLTCVFFAVKRELDVDAIGEIGDKIVGFTMIAIALAALRGASKIRKREKAEETHVRDEEAEGESDERAHLGDEIVLEIDPTTRVAISGSKEHEEMHLKREPHVHQRSDGKDGTKLVEEGNYVSNGSIADEEEKASRKNNLARAKKSAFIVGLVHGVSGISGIIGVLPGVVLHSSSKSSAFIISFLLCSTIAMTLFSFLFGETLRKAASFGGRKFATNVLVGVNVFFALGAFACGCVWLYLSFSGKGIDV